MYFCFCKIYSFFFSIFLDIEVYGIYKSSFIELLPSLEG